MLQGLDGCAVIQRPLWQVLVVQPEEAVQRGLQVMGAVESVRAQHQGQAPVEALHHADVRLSALAAEELNCALKVGCLHRQIQKLS